MEKHKEGLSHGEVGQPFWIAGCYTVVLNAGQ